MVGTHSGRTVDSNRTGIFPKSWTHTILIPIYKKGNKRDPSSYRPIILLSIAGKIYAAHLIWKLTTWTEENHILGLEQAGFRPGRSTVDQCSVLSHLIFKQVSKSNAKLYIAFLDLKAAFNSINRGLLWQKLERIGIEKRLLLLIQRLYSNTSCRVRISASSTLSEPIPINRGMKQGCVLAPTLFDLYLNDLASPQIAE